MSACSPTARLVAFPLDDVEASLEAPTGALERTDALGLAYAVFGTDRFLAAALAAADQLPGIRHSSAYAGVDTARCATKADLTTTVGYACLGFPGGTLAVRALARRPNDNGDYALTLEGVDLAEGEVVEGSATMRVEGVANPTEPERVLLDPIARLTGFPEFFTGLEGVGVRVASTKGNESVDGLASILGETYTFHVATREEASLGYSVRDARNLWTCRSTLSGKRIAASECRTPVGQGDYAVLRF